MTDLTNAEIKDKFTELWHAVGNQSETAYTFAERCNGFFDLAGGLLKINNLSGSSDNLRAECMRLLDVHARICTDYLDGK